ncbi:hypothetical protein BDR04DRAFT_1099636 [Suillus decipiens]|nr:hypothetical protein BDR04DRAFT_1099636 [Suillus decipiens]
MELEKTQYGSHQQKNLQTRDRYEGAYRSVRVADTSQDGIRWLGLYEVRWHSNTTMLNAGRMKQGVFCRVCGTRDSRRITEG